MDCERIEKILPDLLYDELDELTAAAAERHVTHCARCAGVRAALRATKSVLRVPEVEPPVGLEERILAAELVARAKLPASVRAGRAFSAAARWVMRPQTAMAALLLLMVTGGLVLLRHRPGDVGSVAVLERGEPGSDVPTDDKAAASAAADGEPASPLDRAEAAARRGQTALAVDLYDEIAARGGEDATRAALAAAELTRSARGCAAAIGRFDSVRSRYAGTTTAAAATWNAAECRQELGEVDTAQALYRSLLGTAAYADRAQRALERSEAATAVAEAERWAKTEPARPAAPKAGGAAGCRPGDPTCEGTGAAAGDVAPPAASPSSAATATAPLSTPTPPKEKKAPEGSAL